MLHRSRRTLSHTHLLRICAAPHCGYMFWNMMMIIGWFPRNLTVWGLVKPNRCWDWLSSAQVMSCERCVWLDQFWQIFLYVYDTRRGKLYTQITYIDPVAVLNKRISLTNYLHGKHKYIQINLPNIFQANVDIFYCKPNQNDLTRVIN